MFLEKTKKDEVKLFVKLTPQAKKNGIQGVYEDPSTQPPQQRLKIALNAPPVEGKANEALIKMLSKMTNIAKSNILILSGHTQKNKTLLLKGVYEDIKEKILYEVSQCPK